MASSTKKMTGGLIVLIIAMAGSPRLMAQLTPARDLTGTWVGSGTFTNDWRGWRCEYAGSMIPRSVVMGLGQAGTRVEGWVTVDVASQGSGCPLLRKKYTIADGTVSATGLSFSDPAGHRWTLSFTTDLLQGTVTWNGSSPNPREALAVGISGPTGDTPLTRLNGKVRLTRAGKEDEEKAETPAAGGSAAAAAPTDPEQVWEFRTEHGDVATVVCPRETCTARSWTVLSRASFGCTLKLDFDVQFSGTEVRLLAFRKTADSDCSRTTVEGGGSGTADARYPDATRAEGTCRLSYTSPMGPAGGTGRWTARRLQ